MFATTLLLALAVAQPPAEAPVEGKKDAAGLPLGFLRARSLGPAMTSGRVVGFAIHPDDRSIYYVAVASGGVWKTVNSGTTWTPIFDNEGSYSIGYIALDPKNPNVVWVGTGENNSQRSVAYGDGVYKSIDGGRSWTNVGLKASEHIGKLVIDPRDSDTVYVAAQGPLWGPGGDRGLYKTTDGGKTWNRILNIDEHTGITDVVCDPRNPDLLLAASYQRRRHVWTLIDGGPNSGIHRSTDGGKTWRKIRGGLPMGDVGRIGLAVAPTDPDVWYATVEGTDRSGGIFRSADRGVTWEKRNPFDQGAMYYGQISVDPVNKDRIYVMNVLVQVSDDGGRTLRPLGERSKHVDTHVMWVDPKQPNYYLSGCDGGVYESFDRGANWHFKSNLPVTQFYDITVDQNPASGPFYHVFGGTQDNYTLGGPVRTRSGTGITNSDWYVVQGGDGFHCKVDPTDPDTVYGEAQYGGLCRYDRKTGNRVNIQPQAVPGEPPLRWNWDSPLIISPHAPKRLYFAANRLFRSDDRGDHWKPVSPDLTRQINRDALPVMGRVWSPEAVAKHQSTSFYGNIVALAESPKKEGRIYVGTDDGLIQITDDGGTTWRKVETFPGVPNNTYVSKIVASEHDANTVYASFDNHKNSDFKPYLLKSTDAGRTWATVAGNLPERGTVYCVCEDPVRSDLLFCGTEFALYVSADGGQKWQRMRGGLPTIQVKDLVIQKHNGDLVVGTFGRGFYVFDDYVALRSLTPDVLAKDAHVFAVKPTMQYVQSRPYGGGGKAFLGESLYTADNPPVGANLTYYLKSAPKSKRTLRKEAERRSGRENPPAYPSEADLRAEAEEESSAVIISITDASGAVVRTITAPATEGVSRVVWDYRENPPIAEVPTEDDGEDAPAGRRGGGGGRGGRGGGGRGPMVVPGTYRATLSLRSGGKVTPMAGPVDVIVLPDNLSKLNAADYNEIAAHNKRIRQLSVLLTATTGKLVEVSAKVDAMKAANDQAPKPDPAVRSKCNELQAMLREIRRDISGDNVLSARNINVPDSIASRVGLAASANAESITKPTGTQTDAAAWALKALTAHGEKLKALAEKDLPDLEKKLDAIGAPWTPGRIAK